MEVEQTPYAVLCTTSLGGHLSWFETGGGRWHAKPVRETISAFLQLLTVWQQAANFLNKMAFDINPPAPLESQTSELGTDKKYANFKPLRRKWTVGDNLRGQMNVAQN